MLSTLLSLLIVVMFAHFTFVSLVINLIYSGQLLVSCGKNLFYYFKFKKIEQNLSQIRMLKQNLANAIKHFKTLIYECL
jgi:cytochrome b561